MMPATIYDAMILTRDVIKEQMPDVYPFIGWSDLHLKYAGKELQAALVAGATMQCTIRPILFENRSDNGFGAYIDDYELSLIIAHSVQRIEQVDNAVQQVCEFPFRLRRCLVELIDSEKPTGFSSINVKSGLFPVRDAADNYSLGDVRVFFTAKGDFTQESNS